MNSVKVRYFALLREQAQKSEEIYTSAALTYRELYQELAQSYQFKLPPEMIQVAVNDEFTNLDATVEEGAQVVFIPPVAGG
jgi:molybdopterin converting factor subunit 1